MCLCVCLQINEGHHTCPVHQSNTTFNLTFPPQTDKSLKRCEDEVQGLFLTSVLTGRLIIEQISPILGKIQVHHGPLSFVSLEKLMPFAGKVSRRVVWRPFWG